MIPKNMYMQLTLNAHSRLYLYDYWFKCVTRVKEDMNLKTVDGTNVGGIGRKKGKGEMNNYVMDELKDTNFKTHMYVIRETVHIWIL